jgi:hypothetical protein
MSATVAVTFANTLRVEISSGASTLGGSGLAGLTGVPGDVAPPCVVVANDRAPAGGALECSSDDDDAVAKDLCATG